MSWLLNSAQQTGYNLALGEITAAENAAHVANMLARRRENILEAWLLAYHADNEELRRQLAFAQRENDELRANLDEWRRYAGLLRSLYEPPNF